MEAVTHQKSTHGKVPTVHTKQGHSHKYIPPPAPVSQSASRTVTHKEHRALVRWGKVKLLLENGLLALEAMAGHS